MSEVYQIKNPFLAEAVALGRNGGSESNDATSKQTDPSVANVASVAVAWPEMDEAAYYGLAGDVVKTIEPHTEADPNAILIQFLVAVGNAIGRGPFYQVEGDRHYTKLFTVLVGTTSGGRKGTALGRVLQVMGQAGRS